MEMFGRVRESSSPLESLELERCHSKILKDDSLSIYEATLMKLKQGSQRCLDIGAGDDEPMNMEADIDTISVKTPECLDINHVTTPSEESSMIVSESSNEGASEDSSSSPPKLPSLCGTQETRTDVLSNSGSKTDNSHSSACNLVQPPPNVNHQQQHKGKNVSIIHLFSNYTKRSQFTPPQC